MARILTGRAKRRGKFDRHTCDAMRPAEHSWIGRSERVHHGHRNWTRGIRLEVQTELQRPKGYANTA